MPQPPQCAALDSVSTHTPPQRVVNAGHRQTPPAHDVPPVQTAPQPPQLLSFEERFTQRPAHAVNPGRHAALQIPLLHTCAAPQTVPQPPQLRGSESGATQTPPQRLVPTGQRHIEPTQLVPPLHAVPHAPQLALDVRVSTQTPPQLV